MKYDNVETKMWIWIFEFNLSSKFTFFFGMLWWGYGIVLKSDEKYVLLLDMFIGSFEIFFVLMTLILFLLGKTWSMKML